jgi:tetratricopeptide (TPR) repeat protein
VIVTFLIRELASNHINIYNVNSLPTRIMERLQDEKIMTNPLTPLQTQPSSIRVFVSSTFRDMQAERDELVKYIFPKLRKLCEQRGVTWGQVDLRWGITDEQKSEGQVLQICLDEIHRCRPYFIGLLGERYGWVPENIPPELVQREPWLKEHFKHSVTELEILHGVLNNPEMTAHAFFYFRDANYLASLPPERQADFFENDLPDEIEKLGREEARRHTQQRKKNLAVLKERIRKSNFPVRENVSGPVQFGQYVLEDMSAVIDRLFPPDSVPDPLARQAAEHEAFAKSRAQVYISRAAYFETLDAHAGSKNQPLAVLGESGSGKSALLANWAINYRKDHPGELVLMHFIGATPGSTDWAAMLRRILAEIKRHFGLPDEIPEHPRSLRSEFANWLHKAAARGRVVLILDALNQLEDINGAPDLVWMPPHIPENIRIFVSSLPGRPLEQLQKRGWPSLTIQPLVPNERRQLIKEYLALSSRALDKAHTERIASAAQCQNPLFLRVLLDELSLSGMHERLGAQIGLYLQAQSIPELYGMILERCEQDYERERPSLVRDAMTMLWAARRGLAEAEMMEMLGMAGDGKPIPHAYWSPLHLALEQSLLSRGGLIGFFHDYLRQAIQKRYLPQLSLQKQAHLRIAGYFEAQPAESLRRLDELPWQLARAGEWQQLSDLLGDPLFLDTAWNFNSFDVASYWAQVETNSTSRMLDAYQQVIRDPGQYEEQLWSICQLMTDADQLEEAFILWAHLIEQYRKSGDQMKLQACLGNQANNLKDRGDLAGAMALQKEKERICHAIVHREGLATTFGNQANILSDQGDFKAAMALHAKEERIYRELGDLGGLHVSLSNQSIIFHERGYIDKALELSHEAEHICRELGDLHGLQLTLGNRANIFYDRGDMDGAMALNKEKEHICRELGKLRGLGLALGNQGNILAWQGDLEGALVLYKEQERISRDIGNPEGLALSLLNQASNLAQKGEKAEADRLAGESYQIALEHGLRPLAGRIKWKKRIFWASPMLSKISHWLNQRIKKG